MPRYKVALQPTTYKLEIESTKKIFLIDISNNLIANGGGDSTTDWINPSSGLAQFWSIIYWP